MAASRRSPTAVVMVGAVGAPVVVATAPLTAAAARGTADLDVAAWPCRWIVVGGRTSPDFALEALRDQRVRRVDIVVVETTNGRAVEVTQALRQRFDPPLVFGPAGAESAGARVPHNGTVIVVGGPGGLELALAVEGGAVVATVGLARAPPLGAVESDRWRRRE